MADNYLNRLGEARITTSLLYETSGVSLPVSIWLGLEDLAIRFYILPIQQVNTFRGPKYFQTVGPNGWSGIDCLWAMKDYGSINQAVICANIPAESHTALSSNSDVLSVPVNLDGTLTAGARDVAQTFLETYNIPAGWINIGMTYRVVLRTITAFFLYFQRVNGILGHDITLPGGWLDLQYQQVSTEIQTAMLQAAQSFGYNTSGLQPTTTMRTILKYMADEWDSTPIYFGLATL